MQLSYGSYRHALDEAALSVSRETLWSPSGVDIGTRERWSIQGRLHADDQASLRTAIIALVAAYDKQGQDAVLYLPDGVTPSAYQLTSANTLGGVRVTRKPSFPNELGHYTTFAAYTIELEADFVNTDPSVELLEWDEVLNFSGGGERWTYLGTLNGLPQRQTLEQYTTYQVVQSGRAVGYFGYPLPALPIWPGYWHQDQGGISRKLPERVGTGSAAVDKRYEITWEYHFEAPQALVAVPTPRPS